MVYLFSILYVMNAIFTTTFIEKSPFFKTEALIFDGCPHQTDFDGNREIPTKIIFHKKIPHLNNLSGRFGSALGRNRTCISSFGGLRSIRCTTRANWKNQCSYLFDRLHYMIECPPLQGLSGLKVCLLGIMDNVEIHP